MNSELPLAADKKLTITYRVEPGCLGPQGSDHITMFCRVAQKEFEPVEPDVISWDIVPRNDKLQPEMQYAIAGKKISLEQAEKYLILFEKDLDEIEEDFDERIAELIEKFLKAVNSEQRIER
jgi:hypothetical protein